jgi:biofilm PGA synthesis N-glycosyltransferase PgaC
VNTPAPKYVIITPVRDEETHLPATIRSVFEQTLRPAEWIIVNDGSSDGTGDVISEAASHIPWLHVVHRKNRGYRKSGGGVVDAFNEGYGRLQCQDWEYIVKLDGDLSFEPSYFEHCLARFSSDSRLGIAGGTIYNKIGNNLVLESCPAFHVRGATKIYRRACWQNLGGLMAAPGWDTLDEVKAQMHGWDTRTFPDLSLIHHRITGSADGLWGGLVKNGKANYICGYHPLFMMAKCLSRMIRRPYIIGSLALAYGYIVGYLTQLPQVGDANLLRYLRTEQMRRLLGRPTIWR